MVRDLCLGNVRPDSLDYSPFLITSSWVENFCYEVFQYSVFFSSAFFCYKFLAIRSSKNIVWNYKFLSCLPHYFCGFSQKWKGRHYLFNHSWLGPRNGDRHTYHNRNHCKRFGESGNPRVSVENRIERIGSSSGWRAKKRFLLWPGRIFSLWDAYQWN